MFCFSRPSMMTSIDPGKCHIQHIFFDCISVIMYFNYFTFWFACLIYLTYGRVGVKSAFFI